MKKWHLAVGLIGVGGLSAGTITLSDALSNQPVPLALRTAALWTPDPIALPLPAIKAEVGIISDTAASRPVFTPARLSIEGSNEAAPPNLDLRVRIWSREIAPGESLDVVLAKAGLAATARAEVALALGAEYDLRRLRPGNSVTLESAPDGSPSRVELAVEDGLRIEVLFGEQLATRVVRPETKTMIRAGEAVIESSLFATLADAGMPARFAVDLAQMLGGTVNFRRDLAGGEALRLMWREDRFGNEIVGQPDLTFAVLELDEATFEIVWPDDESGRATIYRNGKVMRVFAQPVEGARLSSVFGRRTHPVYRDTRMHKGVDFAAPRGTPVIATAPGRIGFVGRRGGYGRVVEIKHGSDTVTRYAHLSAVPAGLAKGQSVKAGDVIGRVGATGTATGPNLHYEVLIDGRPTDPLSKERLAKAATRDADDSIALSRLGEARARFARFRVLETAKAKSERL